MEGFDEIIYQIPSLLMLSLTCKLHVFFSFLFFFLNYYLVDILFLVLIKINVNLSASVVSSYGRTGDQPCDLITCSVVLSQMVQ